MEVTPTDNSNVSSNIPTRTMEAVKLFQDGTPALNKPANAYQMLGSVGWQPI